MEVRVRECEEKEERRKEEYEKKKNELTEEEIMMTEDRLKDIVGAKYLKVANSVCFLETSVYVVEVPVKEHGKPEIKEAKRKEIENLETYETFEEVEDVGQETIGSRWIVTKKEKHDGKIRCTKQDWW